MKKSDDDDIQIEISSVDERARERVDNKTDREGLVIEVMEQVIRRNLRS